ncbi:MAG: hypothetical protein RLY70_384, partial [Planctomycetota bacterium]
DILSVASISTSSPPIALCHADFRARSAPAPEPNSCQALIALACQALIACPSTLGLAGFEPERALGVARRWRGNRKFLDELSTDKMSVIQTVDRCSDGRLAIDWPDRDRPVLFFVRRTSCPSTRELAGFEPERALGVARRWRRNRKFLEVLSTDKMSVVQTVDRCSDRRLAIDWPDRDRPILFFVRRTSCPSTLGPAGFEPEKVDNVPATFRFGQRASHFSTF